MWQIEREKTSRAGLHGGGFGPRSHDGTLRVAAIRAGLKAGLRAMIQERGAILLVSATLIAALAASSVLDTVPLGAIAGAGVFCIVLLAVFPAEVPPGWTVSLAALITLGILPFQLPLVGVAPTQWLLPGLGVGAFAAFVVALMPWLPLRRLFAFVALAAMAVGFALIVRGGHPLIDVWVMLRDASAGLPHGLNPYELKFPDVPRGQDDYCFPYVPGAFLLAAPAQWLLGDVRWMEGACLVAAVGLTAWHATDRGRRIDGAALPVALLLGAMPGTLHVVEQSWTEPMLLLAMTAAAVLIDRGRVNWAIVPLGVALATKQYLIVLVPLLCFWPNFGWRRVVASGALAGVICLPWFLVNPERFVACTIGFHIFLPPMSASMSIWLFLPGPVRAVAVVLGVAIAYAVVAPRAPRTGSGFLLAAGVVLAVFDFTNKASFLNEWWFASELIVAGLAIAAVDKADGGAKAASELA
jgi:hypothetical protein